MKRSRAHSFRHLVAAALTMSLMTGSFVAQARDQDGDRDRNRHSRHDERGRHDDNRHARNHDSDRNVHRGHDRQYVREQRWSDGRRAEQHWHDSRRDYSRAYVSGYRQGRYEVGRYYRPAGYRAYAWHRGARLPAAYCSSRYVVNDYADYRLYRPPHGHHWVRVDHDVVLAAIATGGIVAVVSDLFY